MIRNEGKTSLGRAGRYAVVCKQNYFAALGTCFWLLIAASVSAEIIKLEGTIKAVDVDARTIMIERMTPSGTKTLTLEIAKKVADLAGLKPGSPISFSYEPDLEIVTDIEAAAESQGKPDSETQQGTDRYIASLSISRDGKATLIIGPSPGPTGFTTEQHGIARTQLPDGTWDSVCVFDQPRVIDTFAHAWGVTYEPGTDMIRLPRNAQRKQAAFIARGLLRAPCLIEWEGPAADNPSAIRVRLSSSGSDGVASAALSISEIQKGSKAAIRATVIEATTTDRKSPSSVDFFKAVVPLDEQTRHDFKLPKGIDPTGEPWAVYFLGAVDSDNTALTKLRIKGKMTFRWGINWDSRRDGAYVSGVAPKSVAERVGIKEGDLILSIGNCKPDSVETAQRCLASVTFDEEVQVQVKRADLTRTFTVMESWDSHR